MKVVNSCINENVEELQFEKNENVPIPKVNPGTVLIEVKACGISVTSSQLIYELFKKRPQLNYAAGHEISGVVIEVGEQVTTLSPGDRVAGILPWDSKYSGFAEFCLCSEFNLVKISDDVSFEVAACGVGDGVKAYTALHYLAHVLPGEIVLITDPLSSWGSLLVQLAKSYKAKAFAVLYDSSAERTAIEALEPDHIVDGSKKSFVSNVLEETGGVGVDVIIDNGVREFSSEEDCKLIDGEKDDSLPHKHDLISCLGVGGRWITSKHNLQLDPPHSEMLYTRCATLGFLFEPVWTLSQTHIGRFQHILKDVVHKLSEAVLKPNIVQTVTLSNIISHMQSLSARSKGKTMLKF